MTADSHVNEILQFTRGQLDILNVFFYYNQGDLTLSQNVTEALGETFADMSNHIKTAQEAL